jgi:citrate synthase
LREYRFSRYVNGKLKAEGAVVMATSDQHAAEKLTKLCCDHPAILIGGRMLPAPDPRADALKGDTSPLHARDRRQKAIGAAEELERLAKENEPWPIQCFELKQRAAQLRQEAL